MAEVFKPGVTMTLETVLRYAAIAPGNRDRFLDAGLIDASGELVPQWRERFLNLRPLDKAEVRQSPGQFLADASDVVYRGMTSGTSGAMAQGNAHQESGEYFTYFAGEAWNRARLAARRRSLAWWNIDESTPILNLASRLQPLRPVDLTLAGTVDAGFLEQLRSLLAVRPAVLRGYPSRLTEVAAQWWQQRGQLFPEQSLPVLAVILTGECHFDFQRSLLERVFDAPIYNEYGCQETGISGASCPEMGRLHLDDDRCLYEVIDGQLVTTDLFNTTMPMVRYRCGDVLELDAQPPCPCGRSGVTARVRGRAENRVKLSRGVVLGGDVKLPACPGILDYALVQAGDRVQVQLAAVESGFAERDLQPLDAALRSQFGAVEIAYFPPSPPISPPLGEPWSDRQWTAHLLAGRWQRLAERPRPVGAMAQAARVFQELVDPALVTGAGVAAATRQRVRELGTAYLEYLQGTGDRMGDDGERAVRWLLQFAETRSGVVFPEVEDDRSRPIAGLYRDRARLDDLATCDRFPLDGFRAHHLLYALENAVATARQRRSPLAQRLNPLLSVFIADLQFFAPRFQPAILASWGEWVWGEDILAVPAADEFVAAWCGLRSQVRREMGENDGGLSETIENCLQRLELAANTPAEVAKATLERGYSQVALGTAINPQAWFDRALAESSHLSPNLPDDAFDPLPWSPILRRIAPEFAAQGDRDRAYACLLAATPPSSRVSAFERLARRTNGKRAIAVSARFANVRGLNAGS